MVSIKDYLAYLKYLLTERMSRRAFLKALLLGGTVALGGYISGNTIFKTVETVTRTVTERYTKTKTYIQTVTQTYTERIKEVPECKGYASIVGKGLTRILIEEDGEVREVTAIWAWDQVRKRSVLIAPKNIDDVLEMVDYAIKVGKERGYIEKGEVENNVCAATEGRICPVTVLDPVYIKIGDLNGKAVQVYRGEAKLTIVPYFDWKENALYVLKAKYDDKEFTGPKKYLEFVKELPGEYRGYAIRALEQLLDKKICTS